MQPLDMADLREQILYNENSPLRSEQEALEKRVARSGIDVRLYCPGCGRSLRTLDCSFCDASCGILHQRLLRGSPPSDDESDPRIETDTRVVSLYAEGSPPRELIRFEIRCLSCYEVLQRNERCLKRCGVRTFLSFEVVEGWLRLRLRWYQSRDHKELPITPGHVFEKIRASALTEIPHTPATDPTFEPPTHTEPQPPPEVVTSTQDRDTTQPSLTEQSTSKHASKKKNVKQKIKQYYREKQISVANNEDLRTAIGCSRQSIRDNVDKLIDEGWLMDLGEGVYARLSTD